MIKTILISVLVLACVSPARAGANDYSLAEPMEQTKQDFSEAKSGDSEFHLKSDDSVLPTTPPFYWSSPADTSLVSTVVKKDVGSKCYLYVNADQHPANGLMRTFAAQQSPTGGVTNAYVTVSEGESPYSGFYCVVRTKLPLFDKDEVPEIDAEDRIVVWARQDYGSTTGRLYVTAGSYTGRVGQVVRRDYPTDCTNVDSAAWHEIAFRIIPEITSGGKVPAFEVWLDQRRLTAAGGYDPLGQVGEADRVTVEAQAMISSRCLFPSLISAGDNASMVVAGAAFTGVGALDSVDVSAEAPDYAKSVRAFTLSWDNGVTSIFRRFKPTDDWTPMNVSAGKAVFEIPVSETCVWVSNTYDVASGYSHGIWTAEGACTVSGDSFLCADSAANCSGAVRSFREGGILLGEGGAGSYATFTDAKREAIRQGKTLILQSDFSALSTTADQGQILINAGEELTIDLNGHLLGNSAGEHPTIQNFGKLTIIDTVGRGRVAPFNEYTGGTNVQQIAVNNWASTKWIPELTIRGGSFEGLIRNGGEVTNRATQARLEGVLKIYRNSVTVAPNCPRFISKNSEAFEFEDKVEDKTLYFGYVDSHWQPMTNACIWCGKGAGGLWSDPDNWRSGTVPGTDDYVIFPRCGTNAWTVNIASDAEIRCVRLDGHVNLHGEHDFTNVQWADDADGRLRGDATLRWSGALPKDLSTLLDDAWAGTVEIVDVGNTSPKLLSALSTWGKAASKVTFRGVRGYYHQLGDLRLPYELVLEDGSDGYAWQNDAGFTGGVIEFPKVSGTGRFVSPANTIQNRQLLRFRDVSDYGGVLDVKGKRVVLGSGEAVTTEAGSIIWSDGLLLPKVVAHTCSVAAFGGTMTVGGGIGDRLAYYDAERGTVGVESEVVKLDPSGALAELCVTNPVGEVRIASWSEDAAIVDGLRVVTNKLLSVNSQSLILAPSAKAARLQFADYYTPSVVTNDGQLAVVKLSLNQNAIPVIGGSGESAQITFRDGMASIVVSGAIGHFWYGLEWKSRLGDTWPSAPYIWTVANPADAGKVELVAPAEGASGFYRVVVSDIAPESAGGDR